MIICIIDFTFKVTLSELSSYICCLLSEPLNSYYLVDFNRLDFCLLIFFNFFFYLCWSPCTPCYNFPSYMHINLMVFSAPCLTLLFYKILYRFLKSLYCNICILWVVFVRSFTVSFDIDSWSICSYFPFRILKVPFYYEMYVSLLLSLLMTG